MPLQLRKGTEAERTSGTFIPVVGEPIYTVDTKQLYIGDGITPGGASVVAGVALEDINNVTLNSENAASILEVSVTSNVVTIRCASDHGFSTGDLISITLTTNTQLNGNYVITVGALTNTFTYELTTPDVVLVVDAGVAQEVTTDGSVLTWSATENAWVNLPPVTSVAALEDVSLTGLADGEILVYNSTSEVWENGPVATTLEALSDVTVTTPATGEVLVYDETSSSWQNQTLSFSGLGSRTTVTGSTGSIADQGSANIQVTGFRSYMLMSIQVSAASYVTVYTSSAARTADSTRPSYVDPLPGSGVIAEVIFASAGTQVITPSLLGFNDDPTPSETIYLKVVNSSGGAASIDVTLKLLQLEA